MVFKPRKFLRRLKRSINKNIGHTHIHIYNPVHIPCSATGSKAALGSSNNKSPTVFDEGSERIKDLALKYNVNTITYWSVRLKHTLLVFVIDLHSS
jgi:hypothetical protein